MTSFINASTSSGVVITPDTSGVLALQTAGTTAVTVDASQNVGIGTSSPSSPLTMGNNKRIAALNTGAATVNLALLDGSNNVYLGDFSTNSSNTYLSGSSNVIFGTSNSNTERMRIDVSGNLLVGLTSATSGGGVLQVSNGITFPATQSASSNANTLDDYEEGTWSAVVTAESGSITTYGIDSATYTKTGNTVYVYLRFNVSNKGTGSNFVVSGLPFTAARELFGIWGETNTTGLTGFMFNAGTGATSFTSRLAANWGGACLVNGNYTVQVTYRV